MFRCCLLFQNYSTTYEKKADEWLASCKFAYPEDEGAAGFEGTNQNLAMSINGSTSVLKLAGAWSHEVKHWKPHDDENCPYCGQYKKVSDSVQWKSTRE